MAKSKNQQSFSANKSVKEAVNDIAQMLHDLLLMMNREHTCKLCEKYS